MQTAAVSLVAAIPAGILVALLVMMILSHSENFKTVTWAAAAVSLALSAVTLLMPFGILLFSGKAAAKAPAKTADKKAAAIADDDEPEVSASDELLADEDGEIGETVEFHGDMSDDIETFDDSEAFEPTDDDLFDEEEEVKPKKKGKKK